MSYLGSSLNGNGAVGGDSLVGRIVGLCAELLAILVRVKP
jgi:hypothetical protein